MPGNQVLVQVAGSFMASERLILSMLFKRLNMRIIACLTLLAGLFTARAIAAPIVQFQETNLVGNLDSYTYFVSGITFQAHEELDIRFDPAVYGTLSSALAGAGFSAMVLQPNNPPGTFGDYSAVALVNNPALAGPFTVDFVFSGSGTPGPQPFYLNLYDQNYNFISTIGSGLTIPAGPTGPTIPEPGSFGLGGLGVLICGGALWTVRRQNNGTARR